MSIRTENKKKKIIAQLKEMFYRFLYKETKNKDNEWKMDAGDYDEGPEICIEDVSFEPENAGSLDEIESFIINTSYPAFVGREFYFTKKK